LGLQKRKVRNVNMQGESMGQAAAKRDRRVQIWTYGHLAVDRRL